MSPTPPAPAEQAAHPLSELPAPPSMSMCATTADYWRAMYEHREKEAHLLSEEIIRLRRAAPVVAPAEPVAWLVTGGRIFADMVCLKRQHADDSVAKRKDGSRAEPLYAAAAPALLVAEQPNSEQPKSFHLAAGAAETVQTALSWIPVRERLPDPWKHVALIDVDRWENMPGDHNQNVHAAGYWNPAYNGFWSVRGERAIERTAFSHWCELPVIQETP